MVRKVVMMAAVAVVVGVGALAAAEEPVSTPAAGSEAQVAAAVNVGNKVCPISGATIEEAKKATVEYEGKIYNLCCPDCKDKFLADPAAAIAKVEAELAKEKAAGEHPAATEHPAAPEHPVASSAETK